MAGGDDVRHGGRSHLPTASEEVERADSSVLRGLTFIFVIILLLSLSGYVKLFICGFLSPCLSGSQKRVSLQNFLVLCVVLVKNGTEGFQHRHIYVLMDKFLKKVDFFLL